MTLPTTRPLTSPKSATTASKFSRQSSLIDGLNQGLIRRAEKCVRELSRGTTNRAHEPVPLKISVYYCDIRSAGSTTCALAPYMFYLCALIIETSSGRHKCSTGGLHGRASGFIHCSEIYVSFAGSGFCRRLGARGGATQSTCVTMTPGVEERQIFDVLIGPSIKEWCIATHRPITGPVVYSVAKHGQYVCEWPAVELKIIL